MERLQDWAKKNTTSQDLFVLEASGNSFQVAPGRYQIEFHFTALSLLIPDRVKFKYQLEGYDAGWVDAGSRRA